MSIAPLPQSVGTGIRVAACAAALLWLPAAVGVSGAAQREHGVHVHGVSQLNLAVDGKEVAIELISPAADIVGFERAPETAEEKDAVAKASALLEKDATAFLFPAEARCALTEAAVRSTLEAARKPHREGHAHGRKGEEAEHATHAEFHVRYHFQCDNPAALTHVDIKLFDHFPAMREVEAQVLTARGQRAQELTPGSARLDL